MVAVLVISLLVLVCESFQTQNHIEDVIRKRPSWSKKKKKLRWNEEATDKSRFELQSVEELIEKGAASLRKIDLALTKADLRKKIKHSLGAETTHILKKTGDPNWPRVPPKEFDARKHWPECADLFDQTNDESFCISDGPSIAASMLASRYCIYTNGTVKERRSSAVLAGCGDPCTQRSTIHNSLKYATSYGVPTGGHHSAPTGCAPWVHEPCVHNNLSFPEYRSDGSALPNLGPKFMKRHKKGKKNDNLQLCSDYDRYDVDCPIECPNEKYGKTMREDSVAFDLWYHMTADEFVIRNDIFTYGPTATSVILFEDLLPKPQGLYKHVRSAFLAWDKFLTIIGWGEEKNQKYWLVVNTWDQWGKDKVFKIPRGVNYVFVEFLIFGGVFGAE